MVGRNQGVTAQLCQLGIRGSLVEPPTPGRGAEAGQMNQLTDHFDAWRRHDIAGVLATLTDDCVIIECYGPTYRGRHRVEQCQQHRPRRAGAARRRPAGRLAQGPRIPARPAGALLRPGRRPRRDHLHDDRVRPGHRDPRDRAGRARSDRRRLRHPHRRRLAGRGAGFTVTGTQRWSLAFICRINGKPTAATEPCVNTPPASAYWSYWHAVPGGAWNYSSLGATGYDPAIGTVEGWAFGSGAPPSVPA